LKKIILNLLAIAALNCSAQSSWALGAFGLNCTAADPKPFPYNISLLVSEDADGNYQRAIYQIRLKRAIGRTRRLQLRLKSQDEDTANFYYNTTNVVFDKHAKIAVIENNGSVLFSCQ
jgi:hypothetical protein